MQVLSKPVNEAGLECKSIIDAKITQLLYSVIKKKKESIH